MASKRHEKILIVGAGYAGSYLALHLQKSGIGFAIINQSEVFHNNFASVRAIVQSGFAKKTMIPLKETFGDRCIHGRLTWINTTERSVVLESGLNVTYETLVIASGRFTGWPFKIGALNQRDACCQYDHFAQKMKEAKNVVVVGGGPTGVETAAEVGSAFPDANITLIHDSNIILSKRVSEACRKKTEEALKNMNIKLILGEKVENLKEISGGMSFNEGSVLLRTVQGREVKADILLDCTGTSPIQDIYKQCLGDSTDEQGVIKVNEFLQVRGHENIFAIGDCNDVKERKIGYLAKLQAQHLGQSLENRISHGGDLQKYELDKMPFEMMLSLGPNLGVTSNKDGSFVWNDGYVLVKQKTLLNDMFWADLNQAMPVD